MGHVFDGQLLAEHVKETLRISIRLNNVYPKLGTILIGSDKASELYVSKKKEVAKQIGAELVLSQYPETVSSGDITRRIRELNNDKSVNGVMIQLPIPGKLKSQTDTFIKEIDLKKDVDGLRDDSPFVPATIRAIITILDQAKAFVTSGPDVLVAVVGANGFVGSRAVDYLSEAGYEVIGLDKDDERSTIKSHTSKADILISATGHPGIIKPDMVNNNSIVIDVGSPKPDVLFNEVKNVAGFITPVPGGVGPVTIVSLMQNLTEATINFKKEG